MAPPARTITVALDMSKAFDTINIHTLIRKLLQTNIPGAPNDTAYKRWSCHSGLANMCKLRQPLPPQQWGPDLPCFGHAGHADPLDGWQMLLIKAGDVETNPGLTTTRKQVWICDICHRQIQVRKQISIRCNRLEHWVHLRCAGIRLAEYTDTWTCHQHRESRLTTHTDITSPHPP